MRIAHELNPHFGNSGMKPKIIHSIPRITVSVRAFINGLAFAFLVLLLPSCIETFEVNYPLNSAAVVVTGMITDREPAYVELSKPAPSPMSTQAGIRPITGASITLVDDAGTRELLVEERPGFYQGQNPGVVGRMYHVEILLSDDRQITSTAQLMKPNPSIDSLYLEPVSYYQQFNDKVVADIRGLNLNLYLNRKDTVSKYYRWMVGGTYKFFTAYDFDFELEPCYYTFPQLPTFIIGESASEDADIIVKTMKFISPNSTYVYGHSVELTQYSQTQESYDYWKKIDDQQNNLGSIFDPPPAQILGNLTFVDEEQDLVFGFFEAASVKTRRVFITSESFTNLDPEINYFADLGVNAPCSPPTGWIGRWIPPEFCRDCSLLLNSTHTKPPFWPN